MGLFVQCAPSNRITLTVAASGCLHSVQAKHSQGIASGSVESMQRQLAALTEARDSMERERDRAVSGLAVAQAELSQEVGVRSRSCVAMLCS